MRHAPERHRDVANNSIILILRGSKEMILNNIVVAPRPTLMRVVPKFVVIGGRVTLRRRRDKEIVACQPIYGGISERLIKPGVASVFLNEGYIGIP